MNDHLLTIREIAEAIFGNTYPKKIAYEKAKFQLRKRGIKPVDHVGRNNLYPPEIVDELRT